MSNEIFWGLTQRDVSNALQNTTNDSAMLFGGIFVAATANALFQCIIPNNEQKKANKIKLLVCTVLGIGAGAWVSFQYADRLHYVAFDADKNFKFAIISLVSTLLGFSTKPIGSVIGLITIGGMYGDWWQSAPRVVGALGSLIGSALPTAYTYFSSKKNNH